MKKLFRRKELSAPAYPTHQAAGVSSRAVAIAGLLVAATATGGCFVAGAGPEDPEVQARDVGVDAGSDAGIIVPSGGGAPYAEPEIAADAGR